MSVELFLWLLIISTTINVWLAESLKRIMLMGNLPHRKNIIPLYTSLTVCTGVGVIYRIPFGLGFELIQVVRLLMLIIFTWIMSMVFYDKIIQTKEQHDTYKKMKEELKKR